MGLGRRVLSFLLAGAAVLMVWRAPLVTRFDGAVGVCLAALGLVAAWLAPQSLTGLLLGLTAVAWFSSNVAASGTQGVAHVAAWLVFVHRALLAHAAIASAARRLKRVALPGVGLLYVLTLSAIVHRSSWSLGVWGVVVVVTMVLGYWPFRLLPIPGRLLSTTASVTIAAAVALEVRGDAYRWLVVGSAALAMFGAVAARRGAARLADSVVELLHGPGRGARAGLVMALGDPDVELAFADGEGWVDEMGRPVSEPCASAGRAVTTIEVDGQPIASVVHLLDVAADPLLRKALRDATALAATNVRLRSEVRHATAEVVRSRRRLVDADLAARAEFAMLLRRGPDAQLAAAAAELRGDCTFGDPPPAALSTIAQIRADFDNLLHGLGPLAGSEGDLQVALRSLADRAPLKVHLELAVGQPLPAAVAEVLWFVASEGVSNVAKHTTCSEVRVTVLTASDVVMLAVTDDGLGGADHDAGTGLVGLTDRVEVIGGHLEVVSSPRGTRLVVTVPLG